ncbi:DUF4231 domain-containing protein [Chrysosporum ovalisporum FSS-45]|uniref:DUF4231 domain-containing protein n=1 Tax=Umezakia ovalisporum TaxID=75695 RepID=UPI002475446C|nr:DUF4231 domain-containing protein [Umezakia ovalisporum]MDH6078498.1 DUF4231 domain-containing protein [Umezakia ovalisporum FSS-45]
MTTTDLTIDNLTENTKNIESLSQLSVHGAEKAEKRLLTLKIIENLLIAFLLLVSILVISLKNENLVFYGVVTICATFFFLIINRQLFQDSKKSVSYYQANKKAEIYTYLLSNKSWQINNFTPVKTQALQYCQDLIDDYKRVRNLSRTIYYILQITTVIFSGITPILVLVDKIEARQTWLKWLPVICPAIASILASIVTSFPFQKNWVSANTVVELLEAEVEKFILGITPYRFYDSSDEIEQQRQANEALEYFIKQVNSIHLQQVQKTEEKKSEKQESTQSNESQSQQTA